MLAPSLAQRPHARAQSPLRRDIQGLRAVAVALVLVYHLWPAVLPGGFVGVDVFFVISGFLITAHLLASAPATGGDLAVFWMRRVRRLLPAALLVLVATVLAARMLAPEAAWRDAAKHAISSALYAENWRLAASSVDYLAAEAPPSPLQHYWSLSVEEQYYLVWPLLVLACVLIARRLRVRLEFLVLSVVSAVLVASLAYSIGYTRLQPARAYFVTGTRVWELAVGALLAVGLAIARAHARGAQRSHRRQRSHRSHRAQWAQRSRRARRARRGPGVVPVLLVWAGFGAIMLAAIGYDGAAYPGSKALLPVLGTAAVIAAAVEGGPTPNRLLAVRAIQYVGDVSYPLYLWHWPLIMLTPYALGHALEPGDKVAILAVSVALAALSTHLVENPARRVRPHLSAWVPIRFAAAGTAAVVALAWTQVAQANARMADQLEQVSAAENRTDDCFAAPSLRRPKDCPQPTSGPVVPAASIAAGDRSFSYRYDCQVEAPFTGAPKTCIFGDPRGTREIALVGNSHAVQWLPALQSIALRKHLRITTFFSEQCFATDARIDFDEAGATENCHDWGQQVLSAVTAGDFDLVVTSERTYKAPAGGGNASAVFTAGYVNYLKALRDAGERVLIIRDTPLPLSEGSSAAACVEKRTDDFRVCSWPRSEWVSPDPLVDAARIVDSRNVLVADLTRWFCPDTMCPAVIGGALVYSDGSHITATYGRSLSAELQRSVLAAMRGPAESFR